MLTKPGVCVCSCFGKCLPKPQLILTFPLHFHAISDKRALDILLTPGHPSSPRQGEREVGVLHFWLWAMTFWHRIRIPGPVKVFASDGSWLTELEKAARWNLGFSCNFCTPAGAVSEPGSASGLIVPACSERPLGDTHPRRWEISPSRRCEVICGTGTLTLLWALCSSQATRETT